ncbi:cation diffusion facilitator CzcD-associated flavoprotein CzcO [Subtercola frigoramans]|uniref:Cation diffusion facilitator CzcD-associated flavoprotein CzcO n=1 Tax=Subtercola frigoramans TaxID=120298 RepID=A0ABS2L7I3_9MICO|nr:NAD(P)-binding domain-containing protein [Subtercola frigoramans]MBM7473065.1 cation diffusion facilitator CzcD-associated flavoprotein CzcO [Subtercola frigoramans]
MSQPDEIRTTTVKDVDVVVIGAGQAGLSAGYHLRRRGFDTSDFVILDSEDAAGGAWRHRWHSLRMATVNGIYDLPGMQKPPFAPLEPAAEVLPRYFAEYERAQQLPIIRPVTVSSVRRADKDPGGRLVVETRVPDADGNGSALWRTRAVINATGTWTKPFWPSYPGRFDFTGRQLHVAQYVSAQEFAGLHVAVVGGGISAVQLLDEISLVTTTSWFTRREPIWRDAEFDSRAGHDAVALVESRVREGLPPQSVVSVTGLIWTPSLRAAAERGVLDRQPMFTRMEPTGVRMADGTFLAVDVILWATGFRPALDHLAPLKLRNHSGGIEMDGTAVAAEPRVHLIGYGPSASTVGANRAGREAVTRLTQTILHRP